MTGCPPDAFSATGQLWGNPLYNWEYHKKTGYNWWILRMTHCMKLYDKVRIDHSAVLTSTGQFPMEMRPLRMESGKKVLE